LYTSGLEANGEKKNHPFLKG